MADTYQSLANLLKFNSVSIADYGISDVLEDAPALSRLVTVPASDGTNHKYVKQTGAPTVGFRAVNDGRDLDASADTLVTVALSILDATWQVDQALPMAYGRGVEAYLERESSRHLKSSFFKLEHSFFNGDAGASYNGLAQALGASAQIYISAGGTTADTASSVYAIRASEEECAIIAGNDGNIDIGETVTVKGTGSATGTYPAYYTPILGWFGVQIGTIHSVGRISNLTEDTDKGLTQALLQQLFAKFPASRPPTHLFLSRRSRRQLQEDITATSNTGVMQPIPREYEGVPLIATDAIGDTEALVS